MTNAPAEPRVILVDGIIGAGKSTTAQWICRALEARAPAVWHHEQDVDHPIFEHHELEAAARASAEECRAFHTGRLERWTRLAEAAKGGPTTIVESSFLQGPIGSMCLARVEPADVCRHIASIADLLAPAGGCLVYLRPRDVELSVRRICDERGDEFTRYLLDTIGACQYGAERPAADIREVVEFIATLSALFDRATAGLAIPVIQVPLDGRDWFRGRGQIGRALDLPATTDTPVDEPQRFVGTYRDIEQDQQLEIVLEGPALRLAASGPRLLPHGAGRFDLEGLNVTLDFNTERGDGVTCHSRMANLGARWERIG